jgi:hypothetical protein
MDMTDVERLRSIKSFPSLVKYLRDDLGWPIESDNFEDLTFDYAPEELGLDPKAAVKIKEIKQLRPLTTDQPFGIFFINFDPKRLPVVVLRRILRALVLKKRTSADRASQAAWKQNDLLFISSYGETHDRAISFAHFREDECEPSDLPTLRVLGWDGRNTVLHLDHAHKTLQQKLKWPTNERDVDSWRTEWSSAFTVRHREVISTAKALASRLAELARDIRNRVNAVLVIESENGPIRKLNKAFKQALIHDLTDDDFADMYAQTIAYGLLSARVSRPAGLVADNIVDMVAVTSPFLQELLQTFLHIGGRKRKRGTALDFDELGVTEVVEALRSANMEAILRDFGDRNPQEDPVIHFYEDFLKEYDPRKRMHRGVIYTPRPVVSFIVRSVHELLQTEFGLEDGLADTITWGEMLKRHPGMKLPTIKVFKLGSSVSVDEPIDPSTPFVQILDPATGTATFLVEVIEIIYSTLRDKWMSQGKNIQQVRELWNAYVPKHLLPRLYGYELMMAPYAIAHMKIGLILSATRYRFGSDERIRVYLTNALEPPEDFSDKLEFDVPALAHEAQAVNDVKRNKRFTVIIGNPPYSQAAGRGAFLHCDVFNRYRSHVSNERRSGPLSNDYVRFVATAQDAVERSGSGIVGMITSSSFLESIVHRGMRSELLSSLSPLYCLNLHGESLPGRQRETDESNGPTNVFDIQEGVVVTIGARQMQPTEHGDLNHCEFRGSRTAKYSLLTGNSVLSLNWLKFQPSKSTGFLFSKVGAGTACDLDGIPFSKIFTRYTTGITTFRDHFATALSFGELQRRIKATVDMADDSPGFASRFDLVNGRGLNIPSFLTTVSRSRANQDDVKGYLFTPFDHRFIWYRSDLLGAPRTEVAGHLLKTNIAMLTTRQTKEPFGVFSTRLLPGHKCIAKYEGTYFAPLYVDEHAEATQEIPFGKRSVRHNFADEFLRIFAHAVGVRQSGDTIPVGLTPEDIFHYIYTVFHSPAYRTRYAELLKIDFPRLPLTSSMELIRDLARLGGELVALHLVEAPMQQAISARYEKSAKGWRYDVAKGNRLPVALTFKGPAEPVVEKVSWSRDTVWLDKKQTQGFHGVREDVWNFHIGGYQVCEKWLKDRKGRTLSADDITHYHRIVIALHETIRLMAEIDGVIKAHGGWPGAFVTTPLDTKQASGELPFA